MNFDHAKLLLAKIERLVKTMSLDKSNVSSIEKDLMVSYLEQFCAELNLSWDPAKSGSGPDKSTTDITDTTSFQPEVKEPVKKEKIKKQESNKPDPESIARKVEENAKKAAEKLAFISDAPIISKRNPKKSIPAKKEVSGNGAPPSETDDEIYELFKFKKASDLSEKLSESPINDLSKVLGLNEKIFTINELFGGDKLVYNHTIDTLNKLNNFDQAKEWLIENVAKKYAWIENEKKKKAKIFIKLVRRRYQ